MKFIIFLSIIAYPLFGTTLDEVISHALSKSTVIKQIHADRELAKLKVEESKANRLGELNLLGDATRYNIERTLAPMTPSSMTSGQPITASKDIYSAGVSYNIPLFTGFAQTRDVEINNLAYKMSDIKEKLTKEQLIYNIRSLYLAILTQIEIKKAQESYTKALQRLSSNIAYEVKLGKKAQIDLIKSKTDIALSKAQTAMLKANIKTTKAVLSSLSNMTIRTVEDIAVNVTAPSYDIDALFKGNSQLAKLEVEELSIKKADKMIQKSNSSNLPQLNLSSYYGKNYGEDEKSGDWDNETIWQVGVNLKYNILDFGKRSANVQKAKISKLKATLKKEQTLLDLKKMIIEAIGKIDQNYAQFIGNKNAYKLSQKSQSIERIRYQNGVSTLNDYLLAQSKTLLAHSKFIESKYNYQKSVYYMDYILEKGEK